MARPKKQTVDYFPHSCTSGKTLYIIEQECGNDGYAFWFKLLEILGTTPGHYLNFNDIAVQRFIVAKTRVSAEKTRQLLQLLAELDAIDSKLWSEGMIWSQNFVDNIYVNSGLRRSETPKKPGYCDDNDGASELLQQKPVNTEVSAEITAERKGKEIKEEESKKNTTVGGGEPPAEKKVKRSRGSKKNPESEPYWGELVKIYFSFCWGKFNEKPSFDGSAPSDMHRIIESLKKRAAEKNIEWTEDVAKLRWQGFLGTAFSDDWLSKNWLLSNLNRQKDKIFLNLVNRKNGQSAASAVGKTFEPD